MGPRPTKKGSERYAHCRGLPAHKSFDLHGYNPGYILQPMYLSVKTIIL